VLCVVIGRQELGPPADPRTVNCSSTWACTDPGSLYLVAAGLLDAGSPTPRSSSEGRRDDRRTCSWTAVSNAGRSPGATSKASTPWKSRRLYDLRVRR
jgi:hypothetical protein